MHVRIPTNWHLKEREREKKSEWTANAIASTRERARERSSFLFWPQIDRCARTYSHSYIYKRQRLLLLLSRCDNYALYPNTYVRVCLSFYQKKPSWFTRWRSCVCFFIYNLHRKLAVFTRGNEVPRFLLLFLTESSVRDVIDRLSIHGLCAWISYLNNSKLL